MSQVINDPAVDIVVEVIGGEEPAGGSRIEKPFRQAVIRVPAHVFPAIRQMAIATLACALSRATREWKGRCFIAEKNLALQFSYCIASEPSVKLQAYSPISGSTRIFRLWTFLAKETKQVYHGPSIISFGYWTLSIIDAQAAIV